MDQRIEALIKLIGTALNASKELQKLRDQFQASVTTARTADEFSRLTKNFLEASTPSIRTGQDSLVEAGRIAAELGKEQPGTPQIGVTPDAIATQFRTLINNAQRDARVPGDLQSAATIKSLDVEVKGLIVVSNNQASIVPPHPDKPIEAGQLSTIRMSFGAIPVLKTEAPTPEEPK